MKKVAALVAIILTGIGVALTYYFFEAAVHEAIHYVWFEVFDTDVVRWLVVPLAVGFSFVFFGLQHYLDKPSEKTEQHGLGAMPNPTLMNFGKVLLIGFFSLLAGVSLGPEAVLVPACMVLGAYVGKKFVPHDAGLVKLVAAAGLMALFTAFFNSFIVGVLSMLLVMSESKTKFNMPLLIVAIISSAAAKWTLFVLHGREFAPLPGYDWSITPSTLIFAFFLALAGYAVTILLGYALTHMHRIREQLDKKHWMVHALLAGLGLALLMLLGGPLTEFTGNEAIVPLFVRATELGALGIVWIIAIKLLAIGWSKAAGYRGGVIFPVVFIAVALVALVRLYVLDFSFIYGFIAVMIGAFVADKKTHVLA